MQQSFIVQFGGVQTVDELFAVNPNGGQAKLLLPQVTVFSRERRDRWSEPVCQVRPKVPPPPAFTCPKSPVPFEESGLGIQKVLCFGASSGIKKTVEAECCSHHTSSAAKPLPYLFGKRLQGSDASDVADGLAGFLAEASQGTQIPRCLPWFFDPQVELLLMRLSLSVCPVNHLMHTVDPTS